MVRPGAFVAAVGADSPGKNEVAPRLMARARVVADLVDQCAAMGDLRHAIAAGAMRREDVHAELAELVVGAKPGRAGDAKSGCSIDRHRPPGRRRGGLDLSPGAGPARPARLDLAAERARHPFAEALRVWARIALLSFGGPAGQIALMHKVLVDERRWIGERRFLHALNFCMLLPGPEAQQLATYVGWLMHGVRGGLVAGILFVLPGMVAIMALSWLYFLYGNIGPVAALFFGLKAAVLAIVLDAVRRIGARALTNRGLVALAAAAFVAIFFFATRSRSSCSRRRLDRLCRQPRRPRRFAGWRRPRAGGAMGRGCANRARRGGARPCPAELAPIRDDRRPAAPALARAGRPCSCSGSVPITSSRRSAPSSRPWRW